MSFPSLRTERLLLRYWEERDREPFRTLCADPEVMRWILDGQPYSAEQTDARIAAFVRCWEQNGYGLWVVAERDVGRCIGFCGMLPLADGKVEIGWRLERAAWGKGYATEAALAARDWAFSEIDGLDVLYSTFQTGNDASRRVMEKLGMSPDGASVNEFGRQVEIYALRCD